MKQQQEESGEGEENKDLEEMCSGITSFPLPSYTLLFSISLVVRD